ncbi:hypothetical protein AT959_00120 [Dechloromonas denitrificans]|uniref:Uncharacterized protein n=1 Tax=Dechloromonas denitrificans TaxID=281362 RepID=A0A133XNZ1_9RHOO|nr:hypothetical protein [Dechloromonas denitrificans]KXB32649.1 hypothetical protein AT959_00120 [Dechloromonas denitrificans]
MKRAAAFVATLLLAAGIQAASADAVNVTKLRLSRVVLFDAPNGAPVGEMLREQYVPGTWTVSGLPEAGFVQIRVDGKTFYVKNSAIDTDKRIASSAECGVKVAGKVEKIGATRALGEECK